MVMLHRHHVLALSAGFSSCYLGQSWKVEAGQFSRVPKGTVVKDPFNSGAPFPNNIIPPARINPVSVRIQNTFWPLPNYGNTSILQAKISARC
jgi:hypothetical protein